MCSNLVLCIFYEISVKIKQNIEIICPVVQMLCFSLYTAGGSPWVMTFFFALTLCNILQIHCKCYIQYFNLRTVNTNKNDNKSKQKTKDVRQQPFNFLGAMDLKKKVCFWKM